MKILLITLLLMTFTKTTMASVVPESFTGNFSVGECAFSKAENATIFFNGKSLNVKFADEFATSNVYLESYEEYFSNMKASLESFSITNEYSVKVNEGMFLPVMRVRLARSETGNRVRLSTLHYETNMTSECVLYRN